VTDLLSKIHRGLRKPPRVIWQRVAIELRGEADRFLSPWELRRLTRRRLAQVLEVPAFGQLWNRLASRPYFSLTSGVRAQDLERVCPGAQRRILDAAGRSLVRRVDLLGTGSLDLGAPVDWHCDFKTGHRWQPAYCRSIEYTNLDSPSDVKVPWEISRLQWLMPAGQAYLLTGEERYAECARDILLEWIEGNPYAHSVNWACTMEVAVRILTFTWLFHVFNASRAWRDDEFRFRFLGVLFLHARFTERHLERSDIAGNHFTADAAGLVFAGLFFGAGADASRWASLGWRLLSEELPRQVFSDGVDFEASIPYHRLVQELFLFPALYRQSVGLAVNDPYRTRLMAMARFTAAYSRPDGTVPVWGDADDARALPFGGQALNDHRYLVGLGAAGWNSEELRNVFSGQLDEVFWTFGPAACDWLSSRTGNPEIRSAAFREGGFFVMRNKRDHVFIDCGPVGLGGRGGHGHNDCLSFEAVLDGTLLVTDSGAYLYTASAKDRNLFRSTYYHNTPRVDGKEINRFIAWNALWSLYYDATPEVRKWSAGPDRDEFEGAHGGYRKLAETVVPVRRVVLDHASHSLTIRDEFEGTGAHEVEIPLHLHPGVEAIPLAPGSLRLRANNMHFEVVWSDAGAWQLHIEPSRVSRSYGIVGASKRLVWRRSGPLSPFEIRIRPELAAR
jgi:uncharacterized heparinase superfamily protein